MKCRQCEFLTEYEMCKNCKYAFDTSGDDNYMQTFRQRTAEEIYALRQYVERLQENQDRMELKRIKKLSHKMDKKSCKSEDQW